MKELFNRSGRILCGGVMLAALCQAQSALGCAACYGESDSPLAAGMNWGIFSLMGVIGGVLAGITMFFVHIGRRSARAAGPQSQRKESL